MLRRRSRAVAKRWCVGGATGSWILGRSQADLDTELDIAQALGMQWIRYDFDWSFIEGTQGSPDWTETDRVTAAVTAHGMKSVGILNHAPTWANGSGEPANFPTNMTQWAAFVTMVTTRYKTAVRHWEVWNEPNSHPGSTNPANYAPVLVAASNAARAVDSGFTILGAVTGPSVDNPPTTTAPLTYIDYLYDNGYNVYFDGLSCHSYTWPGLPDTVASWNSFLQLVDIRARMVAGGDAGKKIWLTECGAPTGTGTDAVTQSAQAQAIDIYLSQSKAWGWIAATFIYSIRDATTTLTDTESNFGVVLNNFTHKTAYDTVLAYTGGGTTGGSILTPDGSNPGLFSSSLSPDGTNPGLIIPTGLAADGTNLGLYVVS